VLPHEFGVFVRSEAQLDRARAAAKEGGLAFKVSRSNLTPFRNGAIGMMRSRRLQAGARLVSQPPAPDRGPLPVIVYC